MTYIKEWAIDPFDIVWKNFFDGHSNYNTLQQKINYPVDIYETENGLCFELAAVGLDKIDLDIQVEGDTLRVKHEGKQDQERNYIAKGITRRSFDLAWKVASKFDLSQLEARLSKGLLTIEVPYSESKAPKKISIK
jgi:HSP20 family molecular chaperone IbpA